MERQKKEETKPEVDNLIGIFLILSFRRRKRKITSDNFRLLQRTVLYATQYKKIRKIYHNDINIEELLNFMEKNILVS